MLRKHFYVFLISIVILGLTLRLIDYDRTPPFGETRDEFMYPFLGISLLTTGTPTSWSDFSAYPEGKTEYYWNTRFRLVSPFLEKPFLYPLIVSSWSLLTTGPNFADVRLSVIRLVPITLSGLTILFVGILGLLLINAQVGLLAALLYAIVPTIVLGNRLSLTENLLVPIILGTLILYMRSTTIPPLSKRGLGGVRNIVFISLGCFLALFTKQIGVALPITLLLFTLSQKQWKFSAAIITATALGAIINPMIGLLTNWELYANVMSEFSRAHTLGLPETIATLFRTPGIGHKESIFLDGTMLLGFILFFSSPFWFASKTGGASQGSQTEFHLFDPASRESLKRSLGGASDRTHNDSKVWAGEVGSIFANDTQRMARLGERHVTGPVTNILILFPLIYTTILCLIEGGTTWYGWHLFPLYPFLMLLLAIALNEFFNSPSLTKFLPFFLILDISMLRFLLLIHPEYVLNWPQILSVHLLISGSTLIFFPLRQKQRLLIVLFILFCLINIYTVINLSHIYPSAVQPN